MAKIKIKNSEIQEIITEKELSFPKYSTQLMNLANQNAQGTRPVIVGQMSELIQDFPGSVYSEWRDWYLNMYPDVIENATERIYDMMKKFQDIINQIDKDMIKKWVFDLAITKTYMGLNFQETILKYISQENSTSYRLANANEESKGIDGYIGKIPVSIKPTTYKTKKALPENIFVEMIYYDKKKDGLWIISDLLN